MNAPNEDFTKSPKFKAFPRDTRISFVEAVCNHNAADSEPFAFPSEINTCSSFFQKYAFFGLLLKVPGLDETSFINLSAREDTNCCLIPVAAARPAAGIKRRAKGGHAADANAKAPTPAAGA